jgi:ribose/xylose/arabinose/galactoside ABC-type transport system permease subunit
MFMLPSLTSGIVSSFNVYDVLQTFADYGLLALGLGLSMVAGEYDLSTVGTYIFGGVVAISFGGSSPLAGIAAAVAMGLLVGVIQAVVVRWLKMSALPVTLGGYLVLYGAAHVVSGSKTMTYANASIGARLDNPILTVFSLRSLITFGVFGLVWIVMRFTRLGPDIRAVGGERRASQVAGVSVSRTLVGVLAVSGMCSAAAGALTTYSLASINPDLGLTPIIFGTIAALLGGVSLAGGRGSAAGIAAGTLAYAFLQETLAIVGAQDYVSDLVTGALLAVVTALTAPGLRPGIQALRTRAVTGRGRAVRSGTIRVAPQTPGASDSK